MTLLEVSVVIAVLLSLITVLLLGAKAWKAGSDRSACLVNIRNVQLASRSFQNMYGKNEGDTFQQTMVIGPTSYIPASPTCPSSGTYSFTTAFPAPGTLFMTCNTTGHVPETYTGW